MSATYEMWEAMWFKPFDTWSPIDTVRLGKSPVQLLTGPNIYRFLLSAGLITNHIPYGNRYIKALWDHCCYPHIPGRVAVSTFNPKSWYGKAVLSYPPNYLLLAIIEAILEGTFFWAGKVHRKRILPLLAKKKFKTKLKPIIPHIATPIQLELVIPVFKSHIRIRFHIIAISFPHVNLCMLTPDHESLRSKPREGVG